MKLSPNRNGNFTSSEIFRLMKPGKGSGTYSVDADTYIDECNMERRLKRALESEIDSKACSWGNCVEKQGFNKLGIEYTLCSQATIQHPNILWYSGTPDAVTNETVADLKCPYTLKSFCQLLDPGYDKGKMIYDAMTIEAVRWNHKDGDKYYWQIVSNAILTNKKTGRLIVYCPYEDELEEIKKLSDGNPDYSWIRFSDNSKLPYLVREGEYKNLNVIEFDIPKRDVDALTERVIECGKKLITP